MGYPAPGAATTSVAGEGTTDRLQLHQRSVPAGAPAVYSPVVLGPREETPVAA